MILIYWCQVQIKKQVLSCNWLGTSNNFWCRRTLKMWISGAFFEQMRFYFNNLTHVVFWTKVELFYKNPLKKSVLKSQFQIWARKTYFFTIHVKAARNSRWNKKYIKYAFPPTPLGIIRGTNEIHTSFISNVLFKSATVLLNFSWTDL